ncbi:GuaB1 family IMP dehydrogenase-related protein [Leucobacter sp. HNU]|uniref:GMP reductase n=1 Tax=Leucobacter sp. HNU TaxID=3236805 RepID=UPI003A808B9E
MQISGQPTGDLTYSDVFLIPRRSAVGSRFAVALAPGDGTPATIPLVAANMNSVSGPRIAAALARRGGLAVLPQDPPLSVVADAIRWVKQRPAFCDAPIVAGAGDTAADALRRVPPSEQHGLLVVRGAADRYADGAADPDDAAVGIPIDDVLGVLPAHRLASVPEDARLGDLVRGALPTIPATELAGGRAAFDAVLSAEDALGASILCVIEDDRVIGTITSRSALRNTLYGPAADHDGRLAVAAAVGINGDVAAKASALAAAGADVLVVDTAHGHQEGMIRALQTIAGLDLGLPLVAGNIVTADGVHDLVNAGATILKVGVGPGAMCTTRMMTAVGRPQFSAVLETAEAASELGAHVWADGGVRYPRDVALALAAGAASIMVGSWFAGTVEAPGELVADADGRLYKESWGMASTKAVQARFGGLDPYERARKELFAEGISSSKIYLDPQRPSVEDLVDMITSGVRSSFTYAGAGSVAEFHERAHVGLQSAAGYEEGKALPVSW